MSENKNDRLNLYDFFGFPDRVQRDDIRQVIDISKLRLMEIDNSGLPFSDLFFEKYSAWSNHINNFSNRLVLHFFLLHFQYLQEPPDTIEIDKYQTQRTANKIFFDTFAEDVSLYLISYFDKHLEMFNDLYDLERKSEKSYKLSREQIIEEMKKVQSLKAIAKEYQEVMKSKEFKQIKIIRNNFVHNKSSSYYGINVDKKKTHYGIEYTSYNSKGISTKETYRTVCSIIKSFEELCNKVNGYMEYIFKQAKHNQDI